MHSGDDFYDDEYDVYIFNKTVSNSRGAIS
jgi:hypothetical protein